MHVIDSTMKTGDNYSWKLNRIRMRCKSNFFLSTETWYTAARKGTSVYDDWPGWAVATVSPVTALCETSMKPDFSGLAIVERFFW